MKKFEKCRYIKSALFEEDYPQSDLPEIAFIGRSNVGKSSLLNHLTQNSKLARISSRPGKTQTLNFFEIPGELVFVDLPGFGYAKVSKKEQAQWSEAIEHYLQSRENLSLLVQLIDLRHPPQKNDLEFAMWAAHHGKKLLIVFTKADKLKKSELNRAQERNSKILQEATGLKELPHVLYSIKSGVYRDLLKREIARVLTH
ncbi:MAG: ribosome biogenesis GTP-binding protein YihA/YsxC [Candidatus Algichlamydia australiensis]|nr:ribosome biogenesis GTP-binding protein YihA/YsxC [Chlamydiales bacterium]